CDAQQRVKKIDDIAFVLDFKRRALIPSLAKLPCDAVKGRANLPKMTDGIRLTVFGGRRAACRPELSDHAVAVSCRLGGCDGIASAAANAGGSMTGGLVSVAGVASAD